MSAPITEGHLKGQPLGVPGQVLPLEGAVGDRDVLGVPEGVLGVEV